MQDRTPNHQLLTKYITEAIKAERNDIFRTSFANNFVYTDVKFDAKDKFEILGKFVKKMRLCLLVVENREGKLDREYPACLTITFTDGSKLTKSVTNSEFVDYLIKIGQSNYIFAGMGYDDPIDWKYTTVSRIYKYNKDFTPTENYEIIHAEIIIGIYYLILRHLKYPKMLNVIDGGCGNGKFLKRLEQGLSMVEQPKLLGFDFNSDNIEECKQEYKGDCHFEAGNLLNIQQIIRQNRESQLLHPKAPTLLILSGSLTRLVLNNAFEALQILQQAMNSNVDYIIGGGQTTLLINSFIAKRLGLKPVPFGGSYGARNFFFYQKMSQKEILLNKINKIKKRNILDLSLSPHPTQLIKTFDNTHYLRNGLTIDLSFCTLTPELINTLDEISKKYADIKLIFWHWDKSMVNHFSDCFTDKFTVSVNVVKDESYLMAPRAFFTEVQTNLSLFPAKKMECKETKSEEPTRDWMPAKNMLV